MLWKNYLFFALCCSYFFLDNSKSSLNWNECWTIWLSQFNSTPIIFAIFWTSSFKCSNALSKITLRGWLFFWCQQSTNFFKNNKKIWKIFYVHVWSWIITIYFPFLHNLKIMLTRPSHLVFMIEYVDPFGSHE